MVQTSYANNKGVFYLYLSISSHDDLGSEQLLHYDVERMVDGDDNDIAHNERLIFCSSNEEILTDDVLQREAPFQSHPENY